MQPQLGGVLCAFTCDLILSEVSPYADHPQESHTWVKSVANTAANV